MERPLTASGGPKCKGTPHRRRPSWTAGRPPPILVVVGDGHYQRLSRLDDDGGDGELDYSAHWPNHTRGRGPASSIAERPDVGEIFREHGQPHLWTGRVSVETENSTRTDEMRVGFALSWRSVVSDIVQPHFERNALAIDRYQSVP